VIISSGSCVDTIPLSVVVTPFLPVSVSGNTLLCIGDIATLTASGGNSYSWSNGNTNATINVAPSVTTTYIVNSSNGSCSGSDTITVFVSPPPIASATNATICSGQTATLTAGGGGNYSWSTGSTTNPLLVSPSSTTSYSVIVSAGSCKDSASGTVTVNASPTASAWSNTTINSGSSATLSASGGGNYSWSNGSTDSVITVSPAVTTDYCVFISNGTCTDSACVTVYVKEPVIDCSAAESPDGFILPNAFSPNGDNQNEKFHLLYGQLLNDCVKEFYIAIYNRWGEKVFEGTQLNFSWDGTYKNKPEDTAVFAYYLKAVLKDGTEVKKKGNVSLLR
jgi:gliding motility-associated-like protein